MKDSFPNYSLVVLILKLRILCRFLRQLFAAALSLCQVFTYLASRRTGHECSGPAAIRSSKTRVAFCKYTRSRREWRLHLGCWVNWRTRFEYQLAIVFISKWRGQRRTHIHLYIDIERGVFSFCTVGLCGCNNAVGLYSRHWLCGGPLCAMHADERPNAKLNNSRRAARVHNLLV